MMRRRAGSGIVLNPAPRLNRCRDYFGVISFLFDLRIQASTPPFISPCRGTEVAEVDRSQLLLYRVNKMRAKHPKKDVESALVDAETAGWTVIATASGHRWGVMRCGEASRAGCQTSVWSTPRNAGLHARQIRRFIRRCPHGFDQVKR